MAIIEMAIVLPVLILFIYGIFVVGSMYEANAGMQHALGEGARYATIYPTPTNTNIKANINAHVFGSNGGSFSVADPVDGTGYKFLSVTYTQPVDFLFFKSNSLTLTRSKKVYVAS